MSTEPDLFGESGAALRRHEHGTTRGSAADERGCPNSELSSMSQSTSNPATSDGQPQRPRTSRWLIDSERSIVGFRVRNFWGLVTVAGRFQRFEGHDDGEAAHLTIDAGSLCTKNKKRDTHLRSADFFDVDNHPQLSFRSTSIADQADRRMRVVGELTVAGKTAQLGFDAVIRVDGKELEIETETSVDQRTFDMTWSPLGMVRSPAILHVKARLVSEDARP